MQYWTPRTATKPLRSKALKAPVGVIVEARLYKPFETKSGQALYSATIGYDDNAGTAFVEAIGPDAAKFAQQLVGHDEWLTDDAIRKGVQPVKPGVAPGLPKGGMVAECVRFGERPKLFSAGGENEPAKRLDETPTERGVEIVVNELFYPGAMVRPIVQVEAKKLDPNSYLASDPVTKEKGVFKFHIGLVLHLVQHAEHGERFDAVEEATESDAEGFDAIEKLLDA